MRYYNIDLSISISLRTKKLASTLLSGEIYPMLPFHERKEESLYKMYIFYFLLLEKIVNRSIRLHVNMICKDTHVKSFFTHGKGFLC